MSYTTIDDPSEYFQTALWSGTGGALTVTNDGNSNLKPDFLWVKNRNNAGGHRLHDSNRPLNNTVKSHVGDAEGTESSLDMTFETNGFSLDKDAGDWNLSGRTYVGWQWKANGGTTSSNTNGSITSTVQASTTSGFSIVTWTGNGSDATIGHGLSSAPEMYVVKNRSDSADWRVGQTVAGNTMTGGNGYYMEWNDDKATTNPGSATTWGSTPTAPTASVFTVGSNNAHNGSSDDMLAYCFHSVKGYSKIGSYTGNGNANGTFVYTGFKPAWVMMKRTDSTNDWFIFDSTRNTFNETDLRISANQSSAESDQTGANPIDILSNGFKCRGSSAATNASGGTYIYMTFAKSPFVTSTGIPNNAR